MIWVRRWFEETALWASAQSLRDVADLTVGWLVGQVSALPGYSGRVDVDEAAAPGLTAALVAANRAGWLTWQSQAGLVRLLPHQPGARLCQRAWAAGLAAAGLAADLAACAARAGFAAAVWSPDSEPVPVTWLQDGTGRRAQTADGWVSARQVRWHYAQGPAVSWVVRRELGRAAQLSIWDPVPGRNDLWDWLRVIATDTASEGCRAGGGR